MPKSIDRPRYIGIDPGKSGGVAYLQGQIVYARKMPATIRDLWDLIRVSPAALNRYRSRFAAIEFVSTSPQMGVKSAGTFMENRGMLLMALTAAGIPFEEVRPAVWQRGLDIRKRKKGESNTEWKNFLKERAQRLFPQIDITLATADALLIAEWIRRRKEGELA